MAVDLEQLALEHLDQGLIVQNADTEILYANPAAVRLLSLDHAEMLRRASVDPVWDVVDPEGNQLTGQEHPASVAASTREPVRGVLIGVGRPRTEDRVWLVVDAVPVLGHEGELTHVVTCFRPVSTDHLTRAELEDANATLSAAVAGRTSDLDIALQKLKQSEAGYRAVIRAMAEGVAVHDRDGSIRDANPAAQEILGLTLEQMQGQHPVSEEWALTREDGSPLPPEEIPSEITRATGEPCRDRVLRVRRSSGEMAWLSVNTDPMVYEGEGAPYSVVATFTDITRERRALRSAEQSRDRLTHLTEAVPGLILEMVVRDSGHEEITFASRRAGELVGAGSEELLANPELLLRTIDPADRERLLNSRQTALETGTALDEDVRAETGDTVRWLRFRSGLPARVHDGVRFTLIVLDVTEQRRITQALYDTQRREGLGVLAAGIAHNFNNMLAAIIPSLEEALDEAPADTTVHALEDALKAARTASDLVRQIMLLAGHGTKVEPVPVDVTAVAEEVMRICHRTLDRRFECRLDTGRVAHTPRVMARTAELQQVFLNLVMNAVDATEAEASPRISVTVGTSADEISVMVEDNGTGMTEEVRTRIGEPFFTTKGPGKGTGLGLASVMGIVREMDGRLEIESEPGEGSVFTVHLPRVAAPDAGQAAGGAPPVETLRGRALVVDDEPLVRTVVVRMLERTGLEVVSVDGGEAALEWLRENGSPDVVFLDLSMPGLSGIDVLERIRERYGALPVVIMSGFLPEDDLVAQADALLQKPMRRRDVVSVVKEVLGDDDAGSEGPPAS